MAVIALVSVLVGQPAAAQIAANQPSANDAVASYLDTIYNPAASGTAPSDTVVGPIPCLYIVKYTGPRSAEVPTAGGYAGNQTPPKQ